MKYKFNLSLWFVALILSFALYQNCGQQGNIALKLDPAALGGIETDICAVNPTHPVCTNIDPTGKVEEYRYIDVTQPTIPDLKIFLILDNSDSMRVSQVNLVNNIEKMFVSNGEGIKDYNSEIFIITTAQLNNINKSLNRTSVDSKSEYQKVIEKILNAQSNSPTQILNWLSFLRPKQNGFEKVTGLLAGDMVGFSTQISRSPSSVDKKYDALDLNFYPSYLSSFNQSSIFSIKYTKGQSIADLVDQLKKRVELLNPDAQFFSSSVSNFDSGVVDNVPLSDVIEKESGLCALGRILHEVKNNQTESLIKRGELATFIIVSDEEEHDVDGLECVKKFKFRQPTPGTLYQGVCADNEASVNYDVPDRRTWTLNVKAPYVRNVRLFQEHIDSEILKRDGKCAIKYKSSGLRVRINKNSHRVNFSRKVLDPDGSVAVKSWSHDLKFDRINKKYALKFDRVTRKHKLTFDRTTLKHQVSFDRELITPMHSVNVQRNLVSKFQKVDYIRNTVLTKEGNKKVIVDSTATISYKAPGVNFSSSLSCTPAWVSQLSGVKSLETPLTSSSLSYEYVVTNCAVANTIEADNLLKNFSGNPPTSCDLSYVKAAHPEKTLLSNQEYNYISYNCTKINDNIQKLSLAPIIDGEVNLVANCNSAYAESKDSTKPTLNSLIGQTLKYSNVVCVSKNTVELTQNISALLDYCPGTDLMTYLKSADGNKTNTNYANYSCTNTPDKTLNQSITVTGVYATTDLLTEIKNRDGSKANTDYENISTQVADTTDLRQSILNISGKYTDESNLLTYIRTKDGNRSNTDYANYSYTNNATYKDDVNLAVSGLSGKFPAICDINYVSSVDSGKPTLSSGQSLLYYNVSCVNESPSFLQYTRSGQTIKFDGSTNYSILPFENLSSGTRDCTQSEINSINQTESQASPSNYVIDGNKLEFISCKVTNFDNTGSDPKKDAILALVNANAQVLTGTSAVVCDQPINTHCAVGSTNNSLGLLSCSNDSANFLSYIPHKDEYRRYITKAPQFDSVNKTLHWFGFAEANKFVLTKLCKDAPLACSSLLEDQNLTIEQYFKKTYAANSDSIWASIIKKYDTEETITDASTITTTCVNGRSNITDFELCNNFSKNAGDHPGYADTVSQIRITKNLADKTSCDELCDANKCSSALDTANVIPFSGKTIKEYFGGNCSVDSYSVEATVAHRMLSKVNLNSTVRDLPTYVNDINVCELTCKESGLCKSAVNGQIDTSERKVRDYIASLNDINSTQVVSCKLVRNAEVLIQDRSTSDEVKNICVQPNGSVLANKYIKLPRSYYSATLPTPRNDVELVKENKNNLIDYSQSVFNDVLGDGFVNVASFSLQNLKPDGSVVGEKYDQVARSVDGVIRDVKSSSDEYGEALRFLGEKVSSQLRSTFQVSDVGSSQQITRVWYTSWFTQGKFIQLKPTDYSASAATIVIQNPEIIEKMKNEAAFKFFVEIY